MSFEIKSERKRKIIRIFSGGTVTIHSVENLFLVSPYIEIMARGTSQEIIRLLEV
jgi:hypothetical protein